MSGYDDPAATAATPKRRGFTAQMRQERADRLAAVGREKTAESHTAPEPVAAPVTQASAEPQQVSHDGPLTRSTRRPFGSMAQKLSYLPRQGLHRHWFNDNPGRIEFATEEAGYKHVTDPRTGKNVCRVVGTREGGAPITAFLLEIPEEWFNDDMARYEQENAAREESIRRGQVKATRPEDQSKFYPTAQGRGINISSPRR